MIKKIKYNSPVILTFALLSFLAYCLCVYTNYPINKNFFSLYRSSFKDVFFYIRMFTYTLGHNTWQGFTGEIMLILALGPMVEEKYGSKKLLSMLLLTTLITALINLAFFDKSIMGASGIVFMLILLASITQTAEGSIPLTLIFVAVTYLASQFFNGLLSENISQLSYILGGACGCIIGLSSKKS